MPWKECNRMDERLRFVARLLDGDKMAVVCREFGISRKTGYKIFNRNKDIGLRGLEDRPRSPYRHPNKLPFQVEKAILRIKQEYATWGAPKIRDKLIKQYPMIKPPAASTIHAVLDRHGLVKRRKRRRYKATGTQLSHARSPNALWCARVSIQPRLQGLFPCLSGLSENSVYPRPSARTTECRSLQHTLCSASAACRCGGYAWALRSNASSRAIPNRTGVMNACT